MRAQYTATDVNLGGWVDVPEAEPRCRVGVPSGLPDRLVVVDNDGAVMVLDEETNTPRPYRDDELVVDTYGDPNDRP